MRKLLLLAAIIMTAVTSGAENYFVVGADTKVYDQPSVKGYVTTNRNDEEVALRPGMAFVTEENNAGWHKIQYSPGIRGYVPDSAMDGNSSMPAAGRYAVENNPSEKVTVTGSGDEWTLDNGKKTLKGTATGNVVIFRDEFGNAAYSLTRSGGKTYVYNYDNAITKFV